MGDLSPFFHQKEWYKSTTMGIRMRYLENNRG
jgi:hypothetical protein